ncbi:MAG TPA: hypothetical protein PLX33_11435 [Alphaproteobacteria bacterium]|nr:hypothetical protein [Alphaproteobacteria bacterium]
MGSIANAASKIIAADNVEISVKSSDITEAIERMFSSQNAVIIALFFFAAYCIAKTGDMVFKMLAFMNICLIFLWFIDTSWTRVLYALALFIVDVIYCYRKYHGKTKIKRNATAEGRRRKLNDASKKHKINLIDTKK